MRNAGRLIVSMHAESAPFSETPGLLVTPMDRLCVANLPVRMTRASR
jgi:hypothetical protein